MGIEVNYIHAINFISLFHTQRGQGNKKNKGKTQKNGVGVLSDKFSWLLFIYTMPKCVSRSYFGSFVSH